MENQAAGPKCRPSSESERKLQENKKYARNLLIDVYTINFL